VQQAAYILVVLCAGDRSTSGSGRINTKESGFFILIKGANAVFSSSIKPGFK
jgi:hypothetical protein